MILCLCDQTRRLDQFTRTIYLCGDFYWKDWCWHVCPSHSCLNITAYTIEMQIKRAMDLSLDMKWCPYVLPIWDSIEAMPGNATTIFAVLTFRHAPTHSARIPLPHTRHSTRIIDAIIGCSDALCRDSWRICRSGSSFRCLLTRQRLLDGHTGYPPGGSRRSRGSIRTLCDALLGCVELSFDAGMVLLRFARGTFQSASQCRVREWVTDFLASFFQLFDVLASRFLIHIVFVPDTISTITFAANRLVFLAVCHHF